MDVGVGGKTECYLISTLPEPCRVKAYTGGWKLCGVGEWSGVCIGGGRHIVKNKPRCLVFRDIVYFY